MPRSIPGDKSKLDDNFVIRVVFSRMYGRRFRSMYFNNRRNYRHQLRCPILLLQPVFN
jgi:hypothetical protein